MGHLYEYSRPDDHPRQLTPTANDPETTVTATADNILGTVTAATTARDATTALPGSAARITLADVIVAAAFTLTSLCITLFISTLLLMPPPSEELVDNPQAFQIELENVLAAYADELIALYAFIAVHSGLGMLLGVGYVVVRTRNNWDLLGIRRPPVPAMSYAVGMGGAGALGIWGGNLLGIALTGDLATHREAIVGVVTSTPGPVALVAILMWIVVLPLAQELFFRGVIYSWLRQSQSLRTALILNGVINGVFNLFLVNFFSSALLAVGLAYIYERTNSVLGSFLAHSSFNFGAILIYAFVLAI